MKEENLKLLQELKRSLKEYALGDIKKASQADAVMGAFILCSCFIDALAGFKYGQDGRLKLGKAFRNFVEEYLKSYDKVSLYYDLRCQLVHNYSESKSYRFIKGKPELHLTEAGENKKYLNLEDLISDLEEAMEKLFFEIETSPMAFEKAAKRYLKYGLV